MNRLSPEEAMRLYREVPLEDLSGMADAERYRHVPERRVSYQIDRNVNYTNVCISACKFCNFHCRPDQPEKAYTLDFEDYLPKIAEMKALGGDQLLLQGMPGKMASHSFGEGIDGRREGGNPHEV